MLDFLRRLFDTSDFMPRWRCGNWSEALGWLHIGSDVAIFGAYVAIPAVLLYFASKRRDVPFHGLFYLFGAFIVSCGTTHLIEAGIFWHPWYRLSGAAKAVTAVVSWLTVFALVPIVPRALELPGIMRLNEALNREVAERRRAQEQLQVQAEALERANGRLAEMTAEADAANRAKSDFLASMSHEIRTPMTAILGYSDELLRDTKAGDDPSRIDAVGTIRENGEHLLAIVNDILDLSRIEAGRLEVDRRPVELPRLIAEVESLMGVLARRKGLALKVAFEGPVPVRITTDPTRLKQVLVNLVSNGLKYTTAGEVRLSARLRDRDGTGRPLLEFRVADTGPGMGPEEVARLFEPYGRAGRRDDPRGSSGLGLVISRRLAELLGGAITVDSEPGRGTTFTLLVDPGPLADVPRIEAGPMATDDLPCPFDPEAELPAVPPGLRVLMAEDTVSNQRLIGRILRDAGVALEVVNDGVEALDAYGRTREAGGAYDLILMDMLMPNLGGLDAAARLRAMGCRTPIVALTANAMEGDRERYLRAGCDAHVTKPIDRAELLGTLARLGRPDRDRSALTEPERH